ncbi:MAG: DUF6596 domain-containing protein [Myxococcota bacterium]
MNASEAVEQVARESYGRLVAWLARRSGDLALAEDAVGDALAVALERWPKEGLPKKPEAWLLVAARRKLIDQRRRARTRDEASDALAAAARRLQDEAAEAAEAPFRDQLPDRRLGLLFACAHPDLPENVRTPLMLQTVLGLSAEAIAGPFLAAPSTISQRLVRAKRRIRDLGLAFEVPPAEALAGRLPPVLDAIYAAYGTGWEADPNLGEDRGLAGEALWLAGLLVRLLPQSGEAKGLYALLCFCESRRSARRSPEVDYVHLEAQDTKRWDHDLILEGEKALWLAARLDDEGPYQAEASIHSVHAHRARGGTTDWVSIEKIYALLVELYPSLGARIGHAASLGRIGRSEDGLAVLEALPEASIARHQPYWAVRAWLLTRLGQVALAREAYARAAGLCTDPAVRAWLTRQSP